MSNYNRPCIVWGATGQAKVAYDILLQEGVEIIHLFDNNPCTKSPLPEIPISYGPDGLIAFVDKLRDQRICPADIDFVTAIGGGNGRDRETISEFMESNGFKSRSLIHKTSIVSKSAVIGKNVQLLAGSIIGAFASIGDCSIINSGANVDHDCIIGRSCHIAPQATLAGEIKVGAYTFVGINATILPRLTIGSGATVGAGAVVTKNVSAGVVVVGNPARPLYSNQR
jgi:sugar O-acyltransferase (sialic acid O-acetyltransferase NeuD family)